MYVDPFVLGVGVTISVETILLVVVAIYMAYKR